MPRRNYRHKPAPLPRLTAHPVTAQHTACRSKRRFATEKMARQAADTQELVSGQELSVYACQRCQGWHLSSRPQGAGTSRS